jgi:hypothetical protein
MIFYLMPPGTSYIQSIGPGQLFDLAGIISLRSALYQKGKSGEIETVCLYSQYHGIQEIPIKSGMGHGYSIPVLRVRPGGE